MTIVPLTVLRAGNASTRPPGQWAMEPGPETTPVDPAVNAPASSTVTSVPCSLVARMTREAFMTSCVACTRWAMTGSCTIRS